MKLLKQKHSKYFSKYVSGFPFEEGTDDELRDSHLHYTNPLELIYRPLLSYSKFYLIRMRWIEHETIDG